MKYRFFVSCVKNMSIINSDLVFLIALVPILILIVVLVPKVILTVVLVILMVFNSAFSDLNSA